MTSTVRSVGIIMDGNRRWAKARGLPTIEGHRAGYEKLKEVAGWARETDIRDVVVYAFSTENWNRAEEEVAYLMDLLRSFLNDEVVAMKEEGVRLKFVGQRDRLPQDIQESIDQAEKETRDGAHTLWLALSYGGRAEILDAVNRLIEEGGEVTEESFSKALWTDGMPDPDIIIRTSGERRLSGFLPWQGVYSELFFIDKNWPDFSRDNFDHILAEYAERERRHGK